MIPNLQELQVLLTSCGPKDLESVDAFSDYRWRNPVNNVTPHNCDAALIYQNIQCLFPRIQKLTCVLMSRCTCQEVLFQLQDW